MFVLKKERDKWHILFEHGDFTAIEEIAGLNRKTVRIAMKTGYMTATTHNALRDYYDAKKQRNNSKKVFSEKLTEITK